MRLGPLLEVTSTLQNWRSGTRSITAISFVICMFSTKKNKNSMDHDLWIIWPLLSGSRFIEQKKACLSSDIQEIMSPASLSLRIQLSILLDVLSFLLYFLMGSNHILLLDHLHLFWVQRVLNSAEVENRNRASQKPWYAVIQSIWKRNLNFISLVITKEQNEVGEQQKQN